MAKCVGNKRKGDKMTPAELITSMTIYLHDHYSLEQGKDYAITFHYGKYHLLCCNKYLDVILAVSIKFNNAKMFDTIHTYE